MRMLTGRFEMVVNLTPGRYRTRWGLPEDLAMVAPAYTRRRSLIAKKIVLGGKSGGRWKTPDRVGYLRFLKDLVNGKILRFAICRKIILLGCNQKKDKKGVFACKKTEESHETKGP